MSSARDDVKPKPATRWIAVFCALTVWALGVFASSSQLHTALHHDADHVDHECAITLFSHGVEDGTGAACLACAPIFFPEKAIALQPVLPVAELLHRFPPGRGPPHC